MSKLKITENYRKSDMSKNNKVVYSFLQNQLYKGIFMLVKVNKIYNL